MSEQLKDFVKARRKGLKMTQQSLADKSGVGIHFIRDIEQGKQDLRIKKVNQVLFMVRREACARSARQGG